MSSSVSLVGGSPVPPTSLVNVDGVTIIGQPTIALGNP